MCTGKPRRRGSIIHLFWFAVLHPICTLGRHEHLEA
jgi:hypothetical protein